FDALARKHWNRAMFGLVGLLMRLGIWRLSLRLLHPIIGPSFPKAFIEELGRMEYLRDLRYDNFVDLAHLERWAAAEGFEILIREIVPQDGFFTGRKLRLAMRRRATSAA
ncbi:MAG: hypothetical protein MUF51_10950, partial [Vicinamibacteria bacterium]|nr:hypothetical protein [Vicinamibacteria bacterium]